jgi:penicillin-binding protein 1A
MSSSRFGRAVTTALLGTLVASSALVAAGWEWFDRTVLSDLPADLSDLRNFRPLTACEIADKDGVTLDSFYLERRFWVDLDTLPDHVWQSYIAAEDQHFFEHPGIDLLGITRALLANFRAGGKTQGGSTLTQQLVKNLLLTPEKSYVRKLKEIVLSWRLERELTKREILQLYVNFVFLGAGNYGVEAAARDYFGRSAKDLDPGEAALLAGLVPAPSRYSPRRDPEIARWRRSLVLGRMVDEGWIDPVDAIDYDDAPVLTAEKGGGEVRGDATAYVTMVRREIRRLFGPDEPFTRGMRIVTAYDPAVQRAAIRSTEQAVTDHLARQGPPRRPRPRVQGRRPAGPGGHLLRGARAAGQGPRRAAHRHAHLGAPQRRPVGVGVRRARRPPAGVVAAGVGRRAPGGLPRGGTATRWCWTGGRGPSRPRWSSRTPPAPWWRSRGAPT